MKQSNTARRLTEIMENRHLRQVDVLELAQPFCKKFDVKLGRNDLSQYISGKVEPRQDKISVLSMALNVSEAWLMGYDVPINKFDNNEVYNYDNIIPMPKMVQVPLIGDIACGSPILAEENIEGYIDLPNHVNADFALNCKGDSMINARIQDGDVVYIRQQPVINNGEIAAVLIGEAATLKRVYYDKNHIILQPENPAYSPQVYAGAEMADVHIIGKAVAFTSIIK